MIFSDSAKQFPPSDQDSRQLQSKLMKQAFQFTLFSMSLEENFQNRIKELENYLNQLLNDNYMGVAISSEKVDILNRAKTNFRESSLQIINNMRQNYEEGNKLHFIPDSYLREIGEEMKQHLYLSYNCLIKSVAETPPEPKESDSHENKHSDDKKQKNNPGKTKFPQKARQILENWYKEHIDDPFPTHEEKSRLAEETGITLKQVKCWFINMRRKRWNKDKEDRDFANQIQKKLIQENSDETKNSSNNTAV